MNGGGIASSGGGMNMNISLLTAALSGSVMSIVPLRCASENETGVMALYYGMS
jgi:hypothetical protein